MEQLILLSKKSSNKSSIKSKILHKSSNLFVSWNKNNDICIPLKLKNPPELYKFKKKMTFPILEESKKNPRGISNSFKLGPTQKDMYEQNAKELARASQNLPKINLNNTSSMYKKEEDSKRRSFSFFKENTTTGNVNLVNNSLRKIPSGKKVIKHYFAVSQAGKNSDGITKTDQDSYLVLTKINNFSNFNVFAVFDGHGAHGHLVSQFLVKYFTDFFSNNIEIKQCKRDLEIFNLLLHDNYKILRNLISSAEEKLKEEENINSDYSGSTCCMVIQIYQKVICVNIGDSRAILFSERINEEIINLSVDHKPKLKKELERIKKFGGVVERCVYDDGVDGPFRVWNNSRQEYPGLAISRSIGDIEAAKLGVISEPDFNLKTIKNGMKYIVIASDGVWEYLSNKNVCDIVKSFYIARDAKGAAEELVKKSSEEWAKKGESSDDITAVVIFF